MIKEKQLFFVGNRVKPLNPSNLSAKLTIDDIGTIESIQLDTHECAGLVVTNWDNGVVTRNSCAVIFYKDYLTLHSDSRTKSRPRLSLIGD